MRITSSQLRRIIKEEVNRVMSEAPRSRPSPRRARPHEVSDDARGQLFLGMKDWLNRKSPYKKTFAMITDAISALMDAEGLGEREINAEIFEFAQDLGFDDEQLMDLDRAVREWLAYG